MSFTKYVDMLERRALFFSRSDLLGDPFEGSFSRANQAWRPEAYKDTIPAEQLKTFSDFSRWVREWTFVNCWHCNLGESAAMWQRYGATKEAVAIKSTFATLHHCLPDTTHLGLVNYIDYDTELVPESNVFYPFLRKRLSFEYEHEVRAVLQQLPSKDDKILTGTRCPDPGRLVSVDLTDLIKTAFVAPSAPDWFLELVQGLTVKYGLSAPVQRSRLDDAPFF